MHIWFLHIPQSFPLNSAFSFSFVLSCDRLDKWWFIGGQSFSPWLWRGFFVSSSVLVSLVHIMILDAVRSSFFWFSFQHLNADEYHSRLRWKCQTAASHGHRRFANNIRHGNGFTMWVDRRVLTTTFCGTYSFKFLSADHTYSYTLANQDQLSSKACFRRHSVPLNRDDNDCYYTHIRNSRT